MESGRSGSFSYVEHGWLQIRNLDLQHPAGNFWGIRTLGASSISIGPHATWRILDKHVSHNSAQLAVKDTASDDLTLVHASKGGDVSAFEELVKRYDRKLLRIAQHLMHNREDAEDVVQEA